MFLGQVQHDTAVGQHVPHTGRLYKTASSMPIAGGDDISLIRATMACVGQLGCDEAGAVSSSLWERAMLSPRNSLRAMYAPD